LEDNKKEDYVDNLENGTTLSNGEYCIEEFINSGGFGMTYLARDKDDKRVVIKECFPTTICRRSQTLVAARARNHAEALERSVKTFRQEAVNLERLAHPNIVRVHHVFDENNTVYMVIDYIEGLDLQEMIKKAPKLLTPDYLVKLLRKLLHAIQAIHENGMLHRDISPDNILLRKDHEPVLIDFGAARGDVSKQSRLLSTLNVVKDGYSPQEFYLEGSLQNESSDLYALAATFYHCIAGETPPNSQKRLFEVAQSSEESYQPLVGRFDGYPENFLGAIDTALQVMPASRLQSAKEWLAIIDPDQDVGLPSNDKKAMGAAFLTENLPMIGAGVVAVLALSLGGYFLIGSPDEPEKMAVAEQSTVELPSGPKTKIAVDEPAVAPKRLPEPEPVVKITDASSAPVTTVGIVNVVEEAVQDLKVTEPTPEIVNVIEDVVSEPKVVAEAIIEEPKIEIIKPVEVVTAVEEVVLDSKVIEPVLDLIEPKVEIAKAVEEPVLNPTVVETAIAEPIEVAQETSEKPKVEVTTIVEDAIPLQITKEIAPPKPVIVAENNVSAPAVEILEPTKLANEQEPEEVVQVTEKAISIEPAIDPTLEAIKIVEEVVPEAVPTEPQVVVEFASTTTPRQSALNDASEFRADTADDNGIIRDFVPQASSGGDFFAGLSNATDRVDEELVTQIEGNSFTIQEALPDSIDEGESDLAPIFELIDPVTNPVIQPAIEEIETVKTFADLTPERAISLDFDDWKLEIPFLMADAVTQGNIGSFPVITAVRQGADLGFSGAWIKPGVTIYSIDQILLPPADDVPAFLVRSFGNRAPNSVSTFARISTIPGAKAQDAPLQLSFSRTLRLSNGLAVKQRFVNKLWQLVVTQIPQTGTENIQVNDVLIKDLNLGLQLSSLNDFTRMINLTKDNGADTAEITIQRGNTSEVAFLTF
jgi:serine/threonine protein kinase